MARRGRLARSVSLNAPTTVAQHVTPATSAIASRWRAPTLKTKVVRFMTTKFLVNQVASENAPSVLSSSYQPVNLFLRIIGMCYRINRKEGKKTMMILMIYNFVMLLSQIIYGCLLLVGLHQTRSLQYRWTNATHFSGLTLCAISIWLNVRIHIMKPKFVDEALSSSSVNEQHVEKRAFVLKLLSICCIVFTCLTVISIEVARFNAEDRFGIFDMSTKRMPFVFTCGPLCRFLEVVLHGNCMLKIFAATSVFMVLSTAIATEASSLASDIKKYPSNQGIDHLVYRFQSIERSIRELDRNFSAVLFGFITLTVIGLFLCLRTKAKLMISEGEVGGVSALSAFIVFSVCTGATVMFGIYVNGQLDEFQSASHKVSDLQQMEYFGSNSVKLLSFMLRLSDNRDRVKVGGMFTIKRQSAVSLVLFIALIGFFLFAANEGCLNLL
uniref:Gustatory receptor n=1 Tax=Panagrellus redivivus TaxID=6233 RepID=A0A7E4V247_PANRE